MRFAVALLAFVLLSGCAAPVDRSRADCEAGETPAAGAVFFGRVIENLSQDVGPPLEDAYVWTELNETMRFHAFTDEYGCYRLVVPYSGTWWIWAELPEYDSESAVRLVADGQSLALDFTLEKHVDPT